MRPFRFEATFRNYHYQPIAKTGVVFANTIEEAEEKVHDEYGDDIYVCEIDNDIIED